MRFITFALFSFFALASVINACVGDYQTAIWTALMCNIIYIIPKLLDDHE